MSQVIILRDNGGYEIVPQPTNPPEGDSVLIGFEFPADANALTAANYLFLMNDSGVAKLTELTGDTPHVKHPILGQKIGVKGNNVIIAIGWLGKAVVSEAITLNSNEPVSIADRTLIHAGAGLLKKATTNDLSNTIITAAGTYLALQSAQANSLVLCHPHGQVSVTGGVVSSGVKRFAKDESLTAEHIGLLAMQRTIALNNNPQSLADFDVKAVLCNTSEAIAGTKGIFKLSFSNPVIAKPHTKIVRMTFNENRNPNVLFGLEFPSANALLQFVPAGQGNPSNNQIELGATLDESIANIQAHFTANPTALTSDYATIAGTGIDDNGFKFIDFEMNYGRQDSEKYGNSATINIYNPFNFQSQITPGNLTFTDYYNNTIAITANQLANGDGYYEVTKFGNTDVVSGTTYINENNELFLYPDQQYRAVVSVQREQDGALVLNDNIGTSWAYRNPFPVWYSASDIFSVSTQRDIDNNAYQVALNIYTATNNGQYLLLGSSWDSNNAGQTLISYASLFRNDSGQPNGTFGAFGLKYFANNTEAAAALTWALNNTSGGWFNTMFDIVSPLELNQDSGRWEMSVRNKTAPNTQTSTWFQTNNVNGIDAYSTTINSAQTGKPERVSFAVLGKIVGIDGSDALIDTSFMFDIPMCSAQDGAMGSLPYTEELNFGSFVAAVIAWRNGKVIDIVGYYLLQQDAGFTGDSILQYPLLVGGYYRPVSAAEPNQLVTLDGKFIYFGH